MAEWVNWLKARRDRIEVRSFILRSGYW